MHCLKTNMTSYDLPADVFEAGETKPARKSKAKVAKNGDISSKKRTFSATQMDVRLVNLFMLYCPQRYC